MRVHVCEVGLRVTAHAARRPAGRCDQLQLLVVTKRSFRHPRPSGCLPNPQQVAASVRLVSQLKPVSRGAGQFQPLSAPFLEKSKSLQTSFPLARRCRQHLIGSDLEWATTGKRGHHAVSAAPSASSSEIVRLPHARTDGHATPKLRPL